LIPIIFPPPVRLKQDAIDLLEVDRLGAIADGFEESAQAEVSSPSQVAGGR
jgi:hypothetical protein